MSLEEVEFPSKGSINCFVGNEKVALHSRIQDTKRKKKYET